jgi:CRP-like cAMP-binding protein
MHHRKFIDRLRSIVGLTADDLENLVKLPISTRSLSDGEYIVREGDKAERCTFVIDGFVSRQKLVGDKAQILAIYIPGDMPDLHSLVLPMMDHDMVCIGPVRVAHASHATVKNMLVGSPTLTYAFWRETLVDAAMYREAVARLGARDAVAKIAHLICELAARLEAVGLLVDNRFSTSLTQGHLAEACGLSNVHVSRSMLELKNRGLLVRDGRSFVLINRRALEALAEFEPSYLHQTPEPGWWPT